MHGRLRVFAWAGMALAWATASAPAAEDQRPATLDDVLAMQTFGSASVSPDGRWAVWERRGAYEMAPRFDRGVRSGVATTVLMIAPVVPHEGDGAAGPLLSEADGAGHLLGPWSPDGRTLVIYRWSEGALELGMVDIEARRVRWTGLTPDLGNTGVAVSWIAPDSLVATIRPDGDLPWPFRFEGTGEAVMSARWRRMAEGQAPSRTALETQDGAAAVDGAEVARAARRRLVVIDAVTGETRVLAEAAVRDMAPSPDGRWIAVLETAEATPLSPTERVVQSAVLTRGRLALVETRTGAVVRPATVIDVAPNLLRWSSDSRQILVWSRGDDQAWDEGTLAAVSASGRVRRFDVGTLKPFEAGRTVDELRPVRADWLNGRPIFHARSGEGRFDWWAIEDTGGRVRNETGDLTGAAPGTETGGARWPVRLTGGLIAAPDRLAAMGDTSAMLVADDALWRMGAEGLRRLCCEDGNRATAEAADSRAPLRLRANGAPDRDWVVVADDAALEAVDGEGRRLWRSDLTECAGPARTLAAGSRAVLRLCLDQGLERLDLVSPSGSRGLDLVNAVFGGLALAQARPIPHRDRKGRPVQSYLYLPPDRTAATVRGLIVHLYPGSGDDGRHVDGQVLHMGPRPQLLAMGGYAVLSVSIPSQRESHRDQMFDDISEGVDLALDAALAAVPDLPGDRMAIVGHSFGGYAALGVATRSSRYRACVVWAAPTDMAGKWGELLPQTRTWPEEGLSLNQSVGSVETGQAGMQTPPWGSVASYAAASPAMQAERITAPVLLITADRDYVPMSQSERMFTALHRLGKPARLVIYWGEGHDNASPANIRDVHAEIFGWIGRALETVSASTSPTALPPMP